MASWQTTVKNVKSRMIELLDKRHLADVVFEIGTTDLERFEAHKLILSASSEIFQNMFYGIGLLDNKEIIKVEGIEPEAFRKLLRYIYTDEAEFTSVKISIATAYASKKYLLNGLFVECLKHMESCLAYSTACEIYEASLKLNADELANKSLVLIKANLYSIMDKGYILPCSLYTVQNLVRKAAPEVDNALLFQCLERWAEELCRVNNEEPEPSKLRKKMDSFLPELRFLSVGSSGYFLRTVGRSGILTNDEVLAIAMNIESDNGDPKHSLPSWCNTKRQRIVPPSSSNMKWVGENNIRIPTKAAMFDSPGERL